MSFVVHGQNEGHTSPAPTTSNNKTTYTTTVTSTGTPTPVPTNASASPTPTRNKTVSPTPTSANQSKTTTGSHSTPTTTKSGNHSTGQPTTNGNHSSVQTPTPGGKPEGKQWIIILNSLFLVLKNPDINMHVHFLLFFVLFVIKTFGDCFLYSHHLCAWLASNTVRRKWMLIISNTWRVNFKRVQIHDWPMCNN